MNVTMTNSERRFFDAARHYCMSYYGNGGGPGGREKRRFSMLLAYEDLRATIEPEALKKPLKDMLAPEDREVVDGHRIKFPRKP